MSETSQGVSEAVAKQGGTKEHSSVKQKVGRLAAAGAVAWIGAFGVDQAAKSVASADSAPAGALQTVLPTPTLTSEQIEIKQRAGLLPTYTPTPRPPSVTAPTQSRGQSSETNSSEGGVPWGSLAVVGGVATVGILARKKIHAAKEKIGRAFHRNPRASSVEGEGAASEVSTSAETSATSGDDAEIIDGEWREVPPTSDPVVDDASPTVVRTPAALGDGWVEPPPTGRSS